MRRRNPSVVAAEILEFRSCLAASPFAVIANDLIITGTARSNTITVTEKNGLIIARMDGRQQTFDRTLIGHVEIYALEGNDKITVATERGAIIECGPGNDKVTCSPETRGIIYGGTGNDRLQGGNVGNDLYGDLGNDTLIGGAGDDILHGDAGTNSLIGNDGEDTLYGGADNDQIFGGNGRDYITDVAGVNLIDAGNDNDIIVALSPRNTILGGAGDDTVRVFAPLRGIIDGGSGRNFLYSPLSNAAENNILDLRLLNGANLTVSNFEQGIFPI